MRVKTSYDSGSPLSQKDFFLIIIYLINSTVKSLKAEIGMANLLHATLLYIFIQISLEQWIVSFLKKEEGN